MTEEITPSSQHLSEKARKGWFDQIVRDTKGMTQEERWEYFDRHPGTQEVLWEFRHKSASGEAMKGFNETVRALGLEKTVETIDKATEGLGSDEYVRWLDDHPSAKRALIKINQVRDSLSESKR